MSKRESSIVLERPIEPIQTPCHKKVTVTLDAVKQPVEPPRTVAVISFDRIAEHILDYAPIHVYLRPWCDGRYSEQCLRRMLTNVINQESWHALCGVPEWSYVHAANCRLIERLLALLDEREVKRAA